MERETVMRWVLAVLVVAAVVVGYWWLRAPDATLVKVGQQAPDLELPSLGATSKTRLSSFRGRPVLLVMFMSNCHLCDDEMPEIERLHRRLLPRGLAVIGVSADTDRAALQRFAQRHQITFPVLEDPGASALRQAYGSWRLPEAYLIDATGTVAAVWLGSVKWSGPDVGDAITRLLPPRKPGSPW
jgi:peroxiredoxin